MEDEARFVDLTNSSVFFTQEHVLPDEISQKTAYNAGLFDFYKVFGGDAPG